MITIITVVFNNVDGLKRTALSVREQECQNFNWIVIDGGSSDGCGEYLESLKAEYGSRLSFISEEDEGIYDAMNKGLALAPSEGHIVFMNSGDSFYSRDTLSNVEKKIESENGLLFVGKSVRFSVDKVCVKNPKRPSHLKIGMMCEHQAAFFNANIAKEIRYDLRYSLSADYDYFLNFLALIGEENVRFLDFAICKFEFGGVSYSKRHEAVIEDALIRVRRGRLSFITSVLICLIQYCNHKIKEMTGVIR